MREGLYGDINPTLLGDVVISMDTAIREASASGLSPEERFDQLLVHGILHLLGYDHEKDSADAKDMEKKEKELQALL
jgi:probable rRNA maturation factor